MASRAFQCFSCWKLIYRRTLTVRRGGLDYGVNLYFFLLAVGMQKVHNWPFLISPFHSYPSSPLQSRLCAGKWGSNSKHTLCFLETHFALIHYAPVRILDATSAVLSWPVKLWVRRLRPYHPGPIFPCTGNKWFALTINYPRQYVPSPPGNPPVLPWIRRDSVRLSERSPGFEGREWMEEERREGCRTVAFVSDQLRFLIEHRKKLLTTTQYMHTLARTSDRSTIECHICNDNRLFIMLFMLQLDKRTCTEDVIALFYTIVSHECR